MKKKLLALAFFALAICVSISIKTSTTYASAAGLPEFECSRSEYYSNVNRSIEVYDEAIGQFILSTNKHIDDGVIGYSDNFAGAFIDKDGILIIGQVGHQTTLDFDGRVVYRQQTNSYNYLRKTKEAVVAVMEKYNIWTVGIDEEHNHVFVNLPSEKHIQSIVEYLREKDLQEESLISFKVDPNCKNTKTANVAHGGESIGDGTIGVNVRDNATGNLGVLTNHHVAPVGTTMSHGGNTIGTSLRGQFGGTIDAAFVPFENQNNWSPTPHAKLNSNSSAITNVRLGNDGHIIQGRPVRRIGQNTGDTAGTIASTSVSANIGRADFNDLFTFTNFSRPGDSGGPVYWDDGTSDSLFLIGLNFATNYTVGYGCRIDEIMRVLDVTPITNDSFSLTNVESNNIQIDGINFSLTGAFDAPVTFNGRTVTQIGTSAFAKQNSISVLSIPDSVTSISSSAFSGCSSLTSITIPNSVTTIDSSAFSGCSSLTSVTIPSDVKSISSSVFSGCSSLTSITIPNSATTIDSSAFYGCSSLTRYRLFCVFRLSQSNEYLVTG